MMSAGRLDEAPVGQGHVGTGRAMGKGQAKYLKLLQAF
jgi:hypothetical protein